MSERPLDDARIRFGRIPVDAVTMEGALAAIEALVEAGRGGAVFTPNVDHVVQAERDDRLVAAYEDVSLSLADGQALVWAARLAGKALPEKVSGSDLVLPLARRAAARGWSLFLLGGAPGVAEKAAARLSAETGVRIAGCASPVIGLEGNDGDTAAALAVRSSGARIVLVALGAPKQELFIHRVGAQLAPAVALGVGASLDFVAGRTRRAPRWMSRAGLEWVFRLAQDPGRLARRYLWNDARLLLVLARELLQRRRPG